ncbi:glutathione peroxidase [Pedobacter hiemivivus]|uniref:Glutathione peroxidase n=1 Tax=Pedobacter hiemivivus TaxID=2530454 RepID=A0A4U1G540_9SPHI|nr:glutathione peroxidase [Pedobacter hiemivivus]TCC85775.1 glutathione peroxidase [Pedobacter hiemivivus]TKC57730.1 glutathione peroxidase [Pedobacter hiemivivus]
MNTLLILLTMLFTPPAKSVYDFSFKTIDGKEVKLSKFKGKKILIVNTASKCGYTPQYEDLEKLQKQYGKNVVLIGFPAGNFGGQELATNSEIKEFCTGKFNVTFLLAEKSSVKGDGITPLFKYLTTAENPDFTGDINWNFEKFLINEKGQLVHRFRSKVKPLDEAITKNL